MMLEDAQKTSEIEESLLPNEDAEETSVASEHSSDQFSSEEYDKYYLKKQEVIDNHCAKKFDPSFDTDFLVERPLRSPATLSQIFGSNDELQSKHCSSMDEFYARTPESFSCLAAEPHVFVPVKVEEEKSEAGSEVSSLASSLPKSFLDPQNCSISESHNQKLFSNQYFLEASNSIQLHEVDMGELTNSSQQMSKLEQSSNEVDDKLYSTSDHIEIHRQINSDWAATKVSTEVPLQNSVDYIPLYTTIRKPTAPQLPTSPALNAIISISENVDKSYRSSVEPSNFDLVMDAVKEVSSSEDGLGLITNQKVLNVFQPCGPDGENTKPLPNQSEFKAIAAPEDNEDNYSPFWTKMREVNDIESMSVSITYQFGSLNDVMGPGGEVFCRKSRLKELPEIPDVRIVRLIDFDYAEDPNYGEFAKVDMKAEETLSNLPNLHEQAALADSTFYEEPMAKGVKLIEDYACKDHNSETVISLDMGPQVLLDKTLGIKEPNMIEQPSTSSQSANESTSEAILLQQVNTAIIAALSDGLSEDTTSSLDDNESNEDIGSDRKLKL